MKENNHFLVTGGAGFIGSALVRHLVHEQGCTVTVVDKLTYSGNRNNLQTVEESPLLHFVQGDISDGPLIKSLLATARPSGIFHLAAESHVVSWSWKIGQVAKVYSAR